MEINRLNKALDSLLVASNGGINSRIETIAFDVEVKRTSSKGYCHCLKIDANGHLRLQDFVEFIDEKIVEYAIPKIELDNAKRDFNETGSPSKIIQLRKKAELLFTDLDKTGEGGEIILYILVQEYLKLPQLISKMSLKTSGNVHYHGADAIHVKYDSEKGNLCLYWGEAKMYSDLNAAMDSCIESIHNFILGPQSSRFVGQRDIDLITSNIHNNVNNTELESFLVRYFDKNDDLSNHLEYKGICFIGFDYDKYSNPTSKSTTQEVANLIKSEMGNWFEKLGQKIERQDGLNIKEMHVFLMPFPSVSEFRKLYLEVIK